MDATTDSARRRISSNCDAGTPPALACLMAMAIDAIHDASAAMLSNEADLTRPWTGGVAGISSEGSTAGFDST
jgi:hypothetical protein